MKPVSARSLLFVLLIVSLFTISLGTVAQEGTSIRVFANDRPDPTFIAHGAITGTNEALFNALHCSLVNLDENYSIQPDLAASFTLSEDETTYTFALNPDAKWHDGTPVTAADVEFTWVAYATPEAITGSRIRPLVMTSIVGGADVVASAAEAPSYADTTKYAGIEIVDDHTITFTLTGPNPLWLITSSQSPNGYILPKHILADIPYADWKTQPIYGAAPLGCGPFQFVQQIEGQFVELGAFADYHLGAPEIDRVFFMNWLTQDVGIAQIESGELDVMLGLTPTDADRLSRETDAQILTTPSAAAYQLSINTFRITDPRVRLAMAYALDREAILDAIFLGQGRVQECCFLNDWAIPEGQTPYPYDPDMARQLLADAGWDSNRELSVLFPTAYRLSDSLLPIVQQQLAEVGIRTIIDPQEQTAFREKLITNQDWDIFFNQGANMLPDPGSFTVWECPTGGKPQSGWFYCDDKMADQYVIGRTTADFATRQAAYQAIQTIFYEEMPTVNIAVPYTIFAVQQRVQGLTPTANRAASTWNIYDWTVTE
ncbi:MAG: ABC transporter substrate-binding protein [Chloroflexi bacterium]|nr:ABC transporter substrate-binding protein [Chloroflexota bacterium]